MASRTIVRPDFRHIQTIHAATAEHILSTWQAVFICILVPTLLISIAVVGILIGQIIMGALTLICAAIVYLKVILGVMSLDIMPLADQDESEIDDQFLPTVTVFGPQYKESAVVARWVRNIEMLDYPLEKLDVMHLIREEDFETLSALNKIGLPSNFRILLVEPKDYGTKPAALNAALDHAFGEFCVIYDAENGPDPKQIKKMVKAMIEAPEDVVAVQAVPVVSNWNTKRWWQKIWAKFEAAEYAGHYTLLNPALTRLGMPAPLPGNSVLFRTDALKAVGKYDRHNLAEDADMSIRLARRGWKVITINSETTEEAPTSYKAWEKQRRRWIHGFMQTYLVHMRNPFTLYRELGFINFVVFQLVVGGTAFVQLVNPFLWALTITYWSTDSDFIRELYPWPVLFLAIATNIIGTFGISLYSMVIGMMRGRMYSNTLLMLFAPIYTMVPMSIATYGALYDLIRKAGWHHTAHEDEEKALRYNMEETVTQNAAKVQI